MLVCKNKTTGELFNDFQSKVKPGTLIQNAVRAGFASEEDLEEVEMAEAEVKVEIQKLRAKTEKAQQAKKREFEDTLTGLHTKLLENGFTENEAKVLIYGRI